MTWSVGQIIPGRELACIMDLERLGIVSYMPLGTKLTKPKGKRKPVRSYFFPFPGYIFIRDAKFHYLEMRTVKGFRRILFDRINELHVKDVANKQRAGAFDIDDSGKDKHKSFKKDDYVKIIMGPLVGQNAIVQRDTNGNYWAFLTLAAMNGMTVKIFVDFIEKI